MSWILVTEFECAVLDFNVLYWIHARTHARTLNTRARTDILLNSAKPENWAGHQDMKEKLEGCREEEAGITEGGVCLYF